MYYFLQGPMPSTQKPKVTLAQRLSGIQQIILAEIRSTQTRLTEAINKTDFAAAQEAIQVLQRVMRMRELTDELLQLARGDKVSRAAKQVAESLPQNAAGAKKSVATTAVPTKKPAAEIKKAVPSRSTTTPSAASSSTNQTAASASPTLEKRVVSSPADVPPAQEKRRGPVPKGLRTPERAFIIPILEILEEKGGQADTETVIAGILERMDSILKPGDFETTSSTDQPRWKVSLYLARTSLLRQGLLRRDVPRGVWAISEAGREYLLQHTQ